MHVHVPFRVPYLPYKVNSYIVISALDTHMGHIDTYNDMISNLAGFSFQLLDHWCPALEAVDVMMLLASNYV